MAYQPKSYRKFLATSVSAAMVATTFGAVAPVNVQQADAAESFSDVHDTYWASDSIQRLADQGIIHGYPDGTYRPGQTITRAQVAELFTHAFNLPVDEDATSPYNDLNDESYATPFAVAVTEAGIMQGRENGTEFAPGMELQRQQMATMLVRAFDLEPVEGEKANVVDLEDAHESHRENIEILSQYNITSTTDGKFRPKETVTRAQFAVFLDRALEVAKPTDILDVRALTDDGHVLEVQFTSPYRGEINRSDVRIFETASGFRKGVESVELSSDGMTLEVRLYDNTSEDAPDEIERLKEYTIQIGDLEYNFIRPGFLSEDDNARIVETDHNDRKITITSDDGRLVLDVSEELDFDFASVLGHEVRVWYDRDENLVDYELVVREDAVLDSIKVDRSDRIETIPDGTKYDLADDVVFIVNSGADDEIVETGDAEALVGNEYDAAKIIFDRRGDVAYVYAYEFADDPILAKELDGDYLFGYDSNELDLEDFLIIKDGQQITADDIEEYDLVFFNEDVLGGDGLAVVYNNVVTGEIEQVYDDSFVVDGNEYDYKHVYGGGSAQYLNEDGDFEELDDDAAKLLQDAGPVTVYLNLKGDVVYVTGEVDQFVYSSNSIYLQGPIFPYVDSRGDGALEIEGVNAEGDVELYDLFVKSLDQITVLDGREKIEYEVDEDFPETENEIDKFALAVETDDGLSVETQSGPIDKETFIVALDDEGEIIDEVISLEKYINQAFGDNEQFTRNIIDVVEDDDGNVTELVFYDNFEILEGDIDENSNFANGYRLLNSTVVYDVSKADSFTDPDEDDVFVSTWGDLKEQGVDIFEGRATIYYNEDEEVTHIVTYTDTIQGETDHVALITKVNRDGGDIVRIEAFVNGERETYEVNKESADFVRVGSLVEITVNKSGDLVTGIKNLGDRLVVGLVEDVSVTDSTITLDNGNTYELTELEAVYDAKDRRGEDFSAERLRSIEEGDAVVLALADGSNRFVEAVVEVNKDDLADYDENYELPEDDDDDRDQVETDGTVTYTNTTDADNVAIEVTDADGNFVEYSRADGEISAAVASFLYNNHTVLEGSDLSFGFTNDGNINAVKAIEFNANPVAGDLTIDANTAFDGLVVEGNENTLDGDLTVQAENVTVRNLTVTNLTVHPAVEEDFTAENVTVKGTTNVSGGGINSVYFTNSTLGPVIVDDTDGVRLVLDGTTATNLNVDADAVDAVIELTGEAEVTTLTAEAAVSVSGAAKVGEVVANAEGVTLDEEPGKISGTAAVEVGGEKVKKASNASATASTVPGDNADVNPLGSVIVNYTYGDGVTSGEVDSLEISIYNDDRLLATNVLQPEKLNTTAKGSETISSPFNLGRSEVHDKWAWVRGEYPLLVDGVVNPSDLPNKVVATFVKDGVTYTSEIELDTSALEIPEPYVAPEDNKEEQE
ncbi:S-layer homology domain-containing protein [Aliibacillus thermotolerans]|uniref:S-layer homology domain-containing protein n=1 Tax=Aliibacillus thermotolerans TaxID=1834418 RepID=A0ABW0UAH8_9BACI|nr:S-layer homology domain-containing protein [Aliibacillus thermotolerans]MDA3128766.1 hypothetical protein [Aliibacillus thermotolerans]